MKCTSRDEELFRLICRHNLLSTKQIHANVFTALKLTTVLRRLRKLEGKGLLKKLGKLYSGTSVWGNSQEANDQATGFYSSSRTNLHTLEHDVALAEIQLLLEKITDISDWYDRRHMLTDSMGAPFEKDFFSGGCAYEDRSAIIPDSLFRVKKDEQTKAFALEVELSLKAPTRYARLTEMYAGKKHLDGVLFVVRDEKIRNGILRWAERWARARELFLVTDYSELLEKKEMAMAYRRGAAPVCIHQIFDRLTRVPRTVHSLAHPVYKRADSPEVEDKAIQPSDT